MAFNREDASGISYKRKSVIVAEVWIQRTQRTNHYIQW